MVLQSRPNQSRVPLKSPSSSASQSKQNQSTISPTGQGVVPKLRGGGGSSKQNQSTISPTGEAIVPEVKQVTQSVVPTSKTVSQLRKQSLQSKQNQSTISPTGQGVTPSIKQASIQRALQSRELRAIVEQGVIPSQINRGTIIERQPTVNEYEKIRQANIRGDLIDRPASEVIKISKQYNELTKDFDKLTPEEQTKVIADLVKIGATVNPVTNQIEPPKVSIGFGENKQEVSISELDTRNKVQLYSSIASKLVGDTAKNIASTKVVTSTNPNEPRTFSIIKSNEPLFTIPSTTVTTPTITSGTIQGDLNKQQLFFQSKTAEAIPVGTAEQIGKVAQNVVRVAPYFTPIGTELFLGEQVYNLGAEVGTKGASGVLNYGKKFGVEAGTVGTLGLFKFAKAIAPETVVTRTTTRVESIQPNIFVKPTLVRTVITPEGQTLQEFSFDVLGRAKKGAEISNVEVVRTRPIFRALGIKGDVIYSSIDKGTGYAFNTLGGIIKESNLASRYKQALDLLVKEKIQRGISKVEALSQAKKELRSYNPSPTSIQVKGKGNVITGTGQDLVLGSGDVSYIASPTKVGNRLTREFTSFKDSNIQTGVNIASKGKTQYYLLETDIQRSYFKNPSQEFMKLSQEGKTTRRVQQVTGLTEVGKVELPFNINNAFGERNIPFTVISEGSISRQTIPLKRQVLSGTSRIFVADLKTSTIEYGQPFKNVPIKPVETKFIGKFTQQQATDLAKTLQDIYGRQVLESAKKVVSTLPKPNLEFSKAPKSSTTIVSRTITPPSNFVGLSSYAGKGQYETTSISSPKFLPSVTKDVITPTIKFETISQIKPENNFKLYTGAINEFDLGNKEFLGTGINTQLQQREQLREQIKTETKQQLRNSQALRNLFVQIQTNRPTIKPPVEPIPIIPVFANSKEGLSKKRLEEISGTFQVFAKKYGKDILLGKVSSKGEATKLLKSELTGTLRASGFVVNPLGKKLKASELNLGRGFRQAKRDRFRVVQERGFRLSSFGERSEIKSARNLIYKL